MRRTGTIQRSSKKNFDNFRGMIEANAERMRRFSTRGVKKVQDGLLLLTEVIAENSGKNANS